MEKNNIFFDSGTLTLYNMLAYKQNSDKIEKDELYKLTQEYLKYLGANERFLNKPVIIERITNIIFNNLLLKSNTKVTTNGIEYKDSDNCQKFGVLKNGSIIFYNQIKDSKKVFSVDTIDNEIVCRFIDYYKDNKLKSEKRVYIDEYGYDYKFIEITDFQSELINEKFREKFKHIIDHIDGLNMYVYLDLGNPSIVPELDLEYLYDSKNTKWEPNLLYNEKIDTINFKDDTDIFLAYPSKIPNLMYDEIQKIKDNYTYFVSKYPDCKKWFIDRYGKKFLIENEIITKDDNTKEIGLLQKIENANLEEVLVNYQNFELNHSQTLEFIKKIYASKSYEKAMALFKRLDENQKIKFIKDNEDYETNFLSTCICSLEHDDNKFKLVADENIELNLWNKIAIISSLKDEKIKVELYQEYEDEIEEFDAENLDKTMEDEVISVPGMLSEIVLDSLKEKDNIKYFIIKFKNFPIVKYNNIKDFTEDEISEILEELDEYLDKEEYIGFFETEKVQDDYIINMLNDNWEEGLEISEDSEIEVQNELNCTFKVLALLNVKDEEKRLSFLDDNIEYFDNEEITMILENTEDVKKTLQLSKKYNLPEDYYYYFMTLAEDEEKEQLLENEKNIDLENFIRVVSSFEDPNRAFEYILPNKKLNVIDKMSAINELEFDYDSIDDDIYEKKFEFIKQNSEAIQKLINVPEATEVFRIFTTEFDCDNKKTAFLESKFSKFFEDEGISL